MTTYSPSPLSTLLFLSLALGCSSESDADPKVPWAEQRTMVIDASRTPVEVAPASGDACITYEDACLKPSERCGKQGADIVLDGEGRLLDYVCYPGEANLSVEEIQSRQGNIAQNQNNAVIVLDALDDGADIEGDLSIDANNVVLYGEDPAAAVISGAVVLDGNNILVRGVRIRGDLTIRANNVTVALAVVEGNVLVQGNNAQVLATDVLGTLTVTGNNAKLYGNHVGGAASFTGKGAECRDNAKAADANADGVLDLTELTGSLSCG